MHANEARKIIKEQEEKDKVESTKANVVRKKKEEEIKEQAKVNSRKALKRIIEGIKETSTKQKRQYRTDVSFPDKDYDRVYLIALADILKRKLEAKGYECEYDCHAYYDNKYEGRMDPELVSSEYTRSILFITITW